MRLALTAALLLALAACKSPPPPEKTEAQLVSETKRALADRERKLSSYHVVVITKQGDAEAAHEFFYRSPNKVRGVVTKPEALTLAFDGTTLFKLLPAEQKLEAYAVKLPKDKAALLLTTQFAPFVPEGYRTPLLPSKGVTARKVQHPRGPEAVELTVATGEGEGRVEVTYVLRFPSGDFLGKRTKAGALQSSLTVDDEFCDPKTGVCVPKVVTQHENGAAVASTAMTTVELNVELPADGFTLKAPEGYATETHELVATDG